MLKLTYTLELEATNLALQNRLDIADRKIQVHESALRSLAQERDSAVTQLGVAYLNTQDTKRENESLRNENAELRAQVAKLSALTRQLAGNETNTQQSLPKGQIDTDHITTSTDQNDAYTQRTSGSTRARRQSKEQSVPANNSTRDDPQSRVLQRVEKEILRMEKERQDEELFSLNLSQPATANHESATKSTVAYKSGDTESRKLPNTGKQRIRRVILEEADTTEGFSENIRDDAKSQTGADKDFTLLSFIDDREIAKLRRRLELERAARKQHQALAILEPSGNTTTASKRIVSEPPRKSSLKVPKDQPARPSSAYGETTATDRQEQGDREDIAAARRRRHSDHSVASQSRRKKMIPELTSAFILPDITLRYAEATNKEPARLSESAQKVLNSVAGHDGKNCTVCKRLLPDGVTHNHDDDHDKHQRGTITVPKPIPVSERMPEPSIYNEDPTIRPSRPPAEALATVLKGLEDELSHLKMQLAAVQQSYSKHDAALSKRQRKSLSSKMERLLKEIDTKADQIYALYDVLEGQKEDGHEMTEKEMEVTLQSIGIDVQNAARIANLTGATDESFHYKSQPVHEDESEDDYEEELPWEGFESTAEMSGRHTTRSVNL